MLKIFLTGTTGYIGGAFLKSINLSEYEVYTLLRQPQYQKKNKTGIIPVYYNGNAVKLNNDLIDINPDYIIHFAGHVDTSDDVESIDKLFESNIKLSNQIFYSLKDINVMKIIIASTHWQNYDVKNIYTKTKKVQEDMLLFYSNKYSVYGTSIRIPDVFGPNDPRPKVWNSIIDSIINKSLLKMSEGNQEIDLMYIDDIVSAFRTAMKSKKVHDSFFNVYNISSLNIMTLKEIVSLFESKFKSKSNIFFGAKPYREHEIMKVKRNLELLPNWKPKFNIEKALDNITFKIKKT